MIDPDLIVRDISAFRDPATPISARAGGGVLEVEIVRDQDARRYTFELSTGRVERQNGDKGRLERFPSFASLLASEDFAALGAFSATSRRIVEQELERTKQLSEPLEPAGMISIALDSDSHASGTSLSFRIS